MTYEDKALYMHIRHPVLVDSIHLLGCRDTIHVMHVLEGLKACIKRLQVIFSQKSAL